jgi:FkbM family methyltransferase
MKKIFIDCGANDGCSIDLFRGYYPNADEYEIHSFEPAPIFRKKLEKKNVFFHEKAVSTSDDNHIFFFDPRTGVDKTKTTTHVHFGSSLIAEKMNGIKENFNKAIKDGRLTPERRWEENQINVKGIDFSKWVMDTFNKNDYIVLKMDIEGAEYPVLEKMIEDKSISYIDVIYIEFHGHKINKEVGKKSIHLVNKLRKEKIKIFVGSNKWNTLQNKIELDIDDNKKNLVFWTGLRSKEVFFRKRHNDYSWMDYSKKTWEFWCKENGHDFYAFEEPIEDDLVAHRPNWQRWFKMLEFIDKYDQILSTDASIMVRWDMPDIFGISEHKFCALRSVENWKWTWESAAGYHPLFDDVDFDVKKYFNSGFVIFNKEHKGLFEHLKDYYYQDHKTIVDYQTNIVKRGTDQPVLNYFVQYHNIDVKFLSLRYGINHIYRWQALGNNWQLKDDPTPFFIKYFYVWIFSGFSDRGVTRIKIMRQTWDAIKQHYGEDDDSDFILDEVQHKDTAKYTTSRKFKKDVLEMFHNDKFKNKMILELGCSQGQSTRVLSHIFKKVIAVDNDDWNLEQAKLHCEGRDNIEFVNMDIYNDAWNFGKVDVVFIDANHTYEAVKTDIENSVKYFDNPIFIFDDYGLPPGDVKQAIDEKVSQGVLTITKFIGEKPEDLVHASNTQFFEMEGVICNYE